MKNFTTTIFVTIILLLSVWTILPLFHTGFFPMHDDTQVARVFDMTKSLKDGMFPVRWVSDLGYGYGYPIFTFYAPLAYYVGGLLGLFLLPLAAAKIMIGLAMITAGVSMYFFARRLFGIYAGVIAGLFYTYAPYHAVDLYVRGDIGELWAYACIPIAFYGFLKIFEEQSKKSISIASLGFAGIILSHNLTALMVTPFLLVYILILVFVSKNKLSALCSLLSALLLGLGLSAFYFLPVFFEMKYTNVLSQIGGGANFRDHFVCFSQLWQSPWGYGGSAKGCVDGLSFMIGKLPIIFSFAALCIFPYIWKKSKLVAWILMLSLLGFLLSIFFMLQISLPIWEAISFMAFLQYPWRFLLLASFFSSLLAGGVVFSLTFMSKKITTFVFLSVVLLVISIFLVVSTKYFVPQKYLSATDSQYTNSLYLHWTVSKISDEYMPRNFIKPLSSSELPKSFFALPATSYIMLSDTTQNKVAQLTLARPQYVAISLAYFPAWNATIDGQKQNLINSPTGVKLQVPAGTHRVRIFYQSTPIELTANGISLASLFILILAIIRKDYVRKSY